MTNCPNGCGSTVRKQYQSFRSYACGTCIDNDGTNLSKGSHCDRCRISQQDQTLARVGAVAAELERKIQVQDDGEPPSYYFGLSIAADLIRAALTEAATGKGEP